MMFSLEVAVEKSARHTARSLGHLLRDLQPADGPAPERKPVITAERRPDEGEDEPAARKGADEPAAHNAKPEDENAPAATKGKPAAVEKPAAKDQPVRTPRHRMI
jgi:hypothetical protein